MADYTPLSVPQKFRGPSGEANQILIDGIVTKISLFHGRVADEADWHVYIQLATPVRQELGNHIRANGLNVEDSALHRLYSELMVIDHADQPFIGDDKFFSADFTLPYRLSLSGSAHPAWDLGKKAIDDQSENLDFSFNSRLQRDLGRAYLQGLLVNDDDHGTRVEIHPLDSIAFAMDKNGKTLGAKFGDCDWPARDMTWRVAVFANSTIHRINGLSALKKERKTTWFLDLPTDAGPLMNVTVEEVRQQLWDGHKDEFYNSRGVKLFEPFQLVGSAVGSDRTRLKLSVTMDRPGSKGGIVVRDYKIKVRPQVFQ